MQAKLLHQIRTISRNAKRYGLFRFFDTGQAQKMCKYILNAPLKMPPLCKGRWVGLGRAGGVVFSNPCACAHITYSLFTCRHSLPCLPLRGEGVSHRLTDEVESNQCGIAAHLNYSSFIIHYSFAGAACTAGHRQKRIGSFSNRLQTSLVFENPL